MARKYPHGAALRISPKGGVISGIVSWGYMRSNMVALLEYYFLYHSGLLHLQQGAHHFFLNPTGY